MRGSALGLAIAILAAVTTLPALAAPPNGKGETPAAKIEAAEKAFEAALAKAVDSATESLRKAEKAATKKGNLAQVKQIRLGIENVQALSRIPASALTDLQRRQLQKARDALLTAYAAAVKEYTRAGDVSEAERMQRKLDALLQRRVLISGAVPTDASEFRGSFFKVIQERVSWHEARRMCEQLGGRLAIVRDAETNRFLTALVAQTGRHGAWLGCSDERQEGVWVWLDGSSLSYSNWAPGQPTNRSSMGEVEHYLGLNAKDGGRWNDLPNHGEVGGPPVFICEW